MKKESIMIQDKAEQKNSNFRRASVMLVSILLILTFLSKSLYNYRLPIVTAARPKEGKFVYTVEGTSILTYAHMDSVYAERDGRIREILVETGDWVKAGQCLMRLESDGTGEMLDITAARNGVITGINIKKGMYVSSRQNTVIYEIAEESGEWICSITVSDEQAEHIDMESVPVVNVISTNEKVEGKIQSITAHVGQNQEGYKITIIVTDPDASFAGARVNITVRQESVLYDTLIPAEALYRDAGGYYVLVLRENDSVLGEGYIARRMSVDLLDSDGVYCAVRGIPSDEYVIVSATNEIGAGTSVFYDGEKMR